jgi:DNA-binding GntR family transcriptional regulator
MEHLDIMKAALDRKPKEACRLMSEHIARTAENILATLDERQG